MKKLILLGAVVLIAAGCNQAANNNPNSNGSGDSQNSQSQQNQQSQQPTTQTYSNQTYGFTFTYPQDMEFVTPTYPNLQDKVVQVQTKPNAYPKTNFGDAAFGVSAQYAKSLAACLALTHPEGVKNFSNKVTINGVTFYEGDGNGAAAGNLYESKVYRTLVGNQTCIELNETTHTANIGNYPAGTVTEVDKTAVQQKLDSILQSFKFSK